MLDGNHTTVAWSRHTGDIAVLPVGSFEQHADFMPLATDIVFADHFGRVIAQALQAALLPTLPFGTCLEHAGFRGSLSLQPETLMRVVRDLADELERQRFRILIVFNSHGGNHALTPVCRAINRDDRRLKIILAYISDFTDPGVCPQGSRNDIHAGEFETSLLLALRPDLVRPGQKRDHASDLDAVPLRQADLTTFGVGYFNRRGVIGYPSLASPEKGRRILAAIEHNLIRYLRDRIRRLRQERRYAGRR
jgi:creatinine amidohydrolase